LPRKKKVKTEEQPKQEKQPRKQRTPKTPPVPKIASYNSEGKEICPACKERKFRVTDCTAAGEGKIKFVAKCPCGHEFSYTRDIKTMGIKHTGGINSGSAEVAATKLHKLSERDNRSPGNTRRRSTRAERKRKK
jgi:hypothetical protein